MNYGEKEEKWEQGPGANMLTKVNAYIDQVNDREKEKEEKKRWFIDLGLAAKMDVL